MKKKIVYVVMSVEGRGKERPCLVCEDRESADRIVDGMSRAAPERSLYVSTRNSFCQR